MGPDEIRETLRYLTNDDMAALMGQAETETFADGELILKIDEPARGIMIVRDGFVVIERAFPQGQIALARCGPGQVIGEVSFVESGGATADVRADGPVTMHVIGKKEIETLLAADFGFAARFYRSLSVVLAARLNRATKRISELSALEVVELNQLHTPQTGQVTVRQLPDELVSGAHEFDEKMRQLERQASGVTANTKGIDKAVSKACDGAIALLEKYTEDKTLLEITYDDLLAFRDEGQVGMGIGNMVFRETYSFLMASATIARCYMKPRGFSDDHETIETIYRNEAEGDGVLGPSIDSWFLSRSLCQSRRNVRDMVLKRLEKAAASRSKRKEKQITCLAAGHASEIFDLLDISSAEDLRITCIDRDDEALLALAERARRRDCCERIKLVRADLIRLIRGEVTCAMPPQDTIYAIGLCEYLDDAEILELLKWAHRQLKDGAPVILTNLHEKNPDRIFMEYMLDMKLHHRTEKQLKSIFAKSDFSGKTPVIARDVTKANMVAICTKTR